MAGSSSTARGSWFEPPTRDAPVMLDYPLPAIVAEIVFNLAGLILFWIYGWPGKAGRGPARLGTWPIPASDFLLFLCLAASGGFTVGSGAGALLRHTRLDSDV